MRRITILLALATLAVTTMASVGAQAATCTNSGTVIPNNSAASGAVNNGQSANFRVNVPSGTAGNVGVQMLNGDVDVTVCNIATGAVVCESHNSAGIADSCGAAYDETATDPDTSPWLVIFTRPLVMADKPLPPGNYRVTVKHCFSSVDGEGCDYTATDPVLGDPFLPGAADDAPAVQFAIGFSAF